MARVEMRKDPITVPHTLPVPPERLAPPIIAHVNPDHLITRRSPRWPPQARSVQDSNEARQHAREHKGQDLDVDNLYT